MNIARNKPRKTIAIEPVIFDVNPPSSPTSPSDRIDSVIPPDLATWSQTYVPQQTPIQQLVSDLLSAQGEPAPLAVISARTNALFRHLYNTPLSPPDVKVLVPALLYDKAVVNKIAVNIGWHYGKSRITAADREAMLTHIFLQSNFEYLFNRVHDQLDRFQHLRPQQPQRQKRIEPPSQSRWPAKYLVKGDAQWLPLGCQCLADMYIMEGLTWPQVKKIEAVARQAKLDEQRTTKVKKVWRAKPVAVLDPITRKLPEKEVDKREVMTQGGNEGEYTWVEMEVKPELPFGVRQKVVVRLPPR